MGKDFKDYASKVIPDYENITNKELKKKTIKALKRQYKNNGQKPLVNENENWQRFIANIGLKDLEIISRGELLDVAIYWLWNSLKTNNGLSNFFETLTTGTKFDAWEIYECLASSDLFSKEFLSLIAQTMTIFDFAIDENDTIADVERKQNEAFELIEEKIDPLLLVYADEINKVAEKTAQKY